MRPIERKRTRSTLGTKEGRDAREMQATVDGARLLRKTLIGKDWEEGRDFKYLEAEGAEHNERAWAVRIDQILEFLFPAKM